MTDASVRILWDTHFHRLVTRATSLLRGSPVRHADDEDAASMAIAEYLNGAAVGRFQDSGEGLERKNMLGLILFGVVAGLIRNERRAKRGGGKIVSDIADNHDLAFCRQPSPADAAESVDTINHLFGQLKTDKARLVAAAKADGCTVAEIAELSGDAERTVANRLRHIRSVWANAIAG